MNSLIEAHARSLVLTIKTLPASEQVRACDLLIVALAQVAQTAERN